MWGGEWFELLWQKYLSTSEFFITSLRRYLAPAYWDKCHVLAEACGHCTVHLLLPIRCPLSARQFRLSKAWPGTNIVGESDWTLLQCTGCLTLVQWWPPSSWWMSLLSGSYPRRPNPFPPCISEHYLWSGRWQQRSQFKGSICNQNWRWNMPSEAGGGFWRGSGVMDLHLGSRRENREVPLGWHPIPSDGRAGGRVYSIVNCF